MAVKQLWTSPPQFVDANGDPYSGALLFFYAAGSSTKQDTFTDSGGGTACDNPITLNSSGYPAVSGTILAPWGTVGETYKIGLAAPGSSDPPNSFIWTEDNVSPINDTTVSIDQWVSGPAPTYVGATQFTLVGDQTSTFQVGRRVKTTNSGGTIYSTITVSAYTSLTTITVRNDAGTLDAGLSAVSYGLLSATGPSVPNFAGPSSDSAAPAGQLFLRGGQIGFPATQVPSSDANTLDDYEEGTWTPVDSSGGTLTFAGVGATYEKIGRQVTARFTLTFPATADANNSLIGGLPFTIANAAESRQGFVTVSDETTAQCIFPTNNATTIPIVTNAGVAITNATMSGNVIYGTALYHV